MGKAGEEHAGRWTDEEHAAFVTGLSMYGKDWSKVASLIQTRSTVQTRSHAQNYFRKLERHGDGRNAETTKRSPNDATKGLEKSPKRRRTQGGPAQVEPEPMDVKSPVEILVKSDKGASFKSASGSTSATITSISVPAAPDRYVPMAPPTAEQVSELLMLSRKTVKLEKGKKVVPKPPPPSPLVMTLPNSNTTPQPVLVEDNFPPRASFARRLFRRAVPLLYLLISLAISCGFISFRSNHPIRTVLQDAWGTVPSKETLQNLVPAFLKTHRRTCRYNPHIILPLHVSGEEPREVVRANITLREFLLDPEGFHLALAPAFFGIYAYIGTFLAWDSHMTHVQSVVGASAGAMAGTMAASGISPQAAAELGNRMTLKEFADPLGFGGIFKGNKFEAIMEDFFRTHNPTGSGLLEDCDIPVAVTAFDLKTLQGRILSKGSMATAARASATFPFLFQPVSYQGGLLIDGGITDILGLKGLAAFSPETPKRIVNVAVGGGFYSAPHGPKDMPEGVIAKEILSLSILNTPQCGPWAMANGPRAIAAARRAMLASMDSPLYYGKEKGHYELHIDASSFVE